MSVITVRLADPSALTCEQRYYLRTALAYAARSYTYLRHDEPIGVDILPGK